MMFEDGKSYTRAQIHEALGGSLQAFLPTVRNEVVCACLTPRLNPAAPKTILVGNGPRILETAKFLSRQRTAIPVFMKHTSNDWRYAGTFKVDASTSDPQEIEPHARRAGRTEVRLAIFLSRVA